MRRLLTLLIGLTALPAAAVDVLTLKSVGMELARDLAQAAVEACRAEGYQVSAVVVNRAGDVQALLRDSLASRYTIQIAQEKAVLFLDLDQF